MRAALTKSEAEPWILVLTACRSAWAASAPTQVWNRWLLPDYYKLIQNILSESRDISTRWWRGRGRWEGILVMWRFSILPRWVRLLLLMAGRKRLLPFKVTTYPWHRHWLTVEDMNFWIPINQKHKPKHQSSNQFWFHFLNSWRILCVEWILNRSPIFPVCLKSLQCLKDLFNFPSWREETRYVMKIRPQFITWSLLRSLISCGSFEGKTRRENTID